VGFQNTGFEKYHFYITSKQDLIKLKKKWIFDHPVKSHLSDNTFTFYVLKNKEIVHTGTINPELSSIRVNSGWYSFDTTMLGSLHNANPLKYRSIERTFNDVKSYLAYYDSAKQTQGFLFSYRPDTRFEGEYTVTVKKTAQTPHPQGAMDFIKSKFPNDVTRESCNMSYAVDDYNLKYLNDRFRLTFESKESLYQILKKSELDVQDWKLRKFITTTFWIE
jgi:hypothetical protein